MNAATALLRDPLFWILVLIFGIGAASSPYFLEPVNLENLLRNSAVTGLLALGVSLVLLTGRIDLSIAAIMLFSMFASVILANDLGGLIGEHWLVRRGTFVGPMPLAMAIALGAGALVGVLNGIGVAYLKISSFIMTLVTLTALRGVNTMLTLGQPYYLRGGGFDWLGDRLILGLPSGFVILLGFLLVIWLFLSQTVIGGRIYAIGGNETAIRYSGVKTERLVVLVFAISGFCAAMAGLLLTARLKSVDATLGTGYELTAIGIAVVAGVALSGGIGSPVRVVAASVALSAALNLFQLWGVSTRAQNLVVGLVLIAGVGIATHARTRRRRAAQLVGPS